MKKKIIIILIALMLGGGISYYFFTRKYVVDDNELMSVKAFQIGAFTNYDNALRVAERNNGIVVSEEEIFRVYVAILSSQDAVDIMRKYYDSIGLNYYLRDIMVDAKFLDSLKDSEKLLVSSDTEVYKVINLSVLNMYEEFL